MHHDDQNRSKGDRRSLRRPVIVPADSIVPRRARWRHKESGSVQMLQAHALSQTVRFTVIIHGESAPLASDNQHSAFDVK